MSLLDDLKSKNAANRMMDVLVEDVFEKHNVREKLQQLPPEKKEKIRNVVTDIQKQVDALLK
ncbi:MAG TPA: spore coat protein [Bacillales bacterium]|nr:spore coat protein [Bacillales bacterium]